MHDNHEHVRDLYFLLSRVAVIHLSFRSIQQCRCCYCCPE